MKLILLTFHRSCNYGAVLQAWATQEWLRLRGHECKCLDFFPEVDVHNRKLSTALFKSKWNKNIITRALYCSIKYRDFKSKQAVFDRFVAKRMICTSRQYVTVSEIEQDLPEADAYITGSDQIWDANSKNLLDYWDVFLWSFLPDGKKRISLSSSFGRSELDGDEIKRMRPLLKKYDHVSVREKSGLALLEQMGINDAVWLLDPTLLLPHPVWKQLFSKASLLEQYEDGYVLIYLVNRNFQALSYAARQAKKLKLRLLCISQSIYDKLGKHTLIYCPTPEEWLSLFHHATYIVTDSFHGTAFSINFNKKFVTVLPAQRATRLESILELTGLTSRILKNYDDFDILDKPIDYGCVNVILDRERKKADKFLSKALRLEEGEYAEPSLHHE